MFRNLFLSLGVFFVGHVCLANDVSSRASGPLCFFDVDQKITLTTDIWKGEQPGQIEAKLVGDAENLSVVSKGASSDHPGAHEVVLEHRKDNTGWVGVELTPQGSTDSKYYALEFRSKLSSCSKGAHFQVDYK